jgi:hypothetical protein
MAPHESTTAKGRDLEAGLEVQAAPSGATDSHSPSGDATSGGAGDGHGHGHGHDEKTGPDWKGDVLQCCGACAARSSATEVQGFFSWSRCDTPRAAYHTTDGPSSDCECVPHRTSGSVQARAWT